MRAARILGPFVLGVALLFLKHPSVASAATEYCPAAIYEIHAFSTESGGDASLWSYAVSALSPRTVRGQITVDTDDGWYVFQFPAVTVTRHVGAYGMGSHGVWHKPDYVSPVLYVMFPHPVKTKYWWLSEALTSGEEVFGWDARGLVGCDPTIGAGGGYSNIGAREGVDPPIAIDATPPPGASVVVAMRTSPPPGATSCAQPFRPATVVSLAQPRYPAEAEDQLAGYTVSVIVFVSISASGSVDDAWVVGSSTNRAMDADALRVARQSTYRSGVALCRAVPGTYWYVVDYSQ